MGKLINILAASIGGGIVLGAGIRLGEAIANQLPVPGAEAADRLAGRLGELEERLHTLEVEMPAAAAVREPAAAGTSAASSPAAGQHLRDELRGWLEESITLRMAEVETRLRTESDRGQKQMLDAFSENVQTRVIQRISQLEDEVAGQSAAMSELRECSLRTELSVQKLLGALDKLIVKQPAEPAASAPTAEPAAATWVESGSSAEKVTELLPEPPLGMEPPPSLNPSSKPRRWKIFG